MNGMGVGYKHLDQLRDLVQNEGDKSSRIRPLLDGMGTLDTSILTGYIIWPKGDMRLHTCRVYKTLNEIMAWCDQLSMEIKCTEDATTDRTYGKLRGLYLVYEHCQNMLGHSGSMPSEVPNQSEDAKK